MIKYVPNRHVKRLFPYAFYEELFNQLVEFVPENKAFLYRNSDLSALLDTENPEIQFENFRRLMQEEALGEIKMEEYNIYALDQGEFLILDQFIRRSDVESFINNQPINRYALLVQIYDSNEKPIFSKDSRLSVIRELNPISVNDSNLALVMMRTMSADNQESIDDTIDLGVIKGPEHFINQLIIDPEVERTDRFE